MHTVKQLHQAKLAYVGILKLVHGNIAELTLIRLQHLGVGLEQEDGLHDEIVKIHRPRGLQAILIGAVDTGDLLHTEILHAVFLLKGIGIKQIFLGAAHRAHHRFYGKGFFVDVQGLHRLSHGVFGIGGIVDGKASVVAETVAVGTEYPCADRMEGPRPDRICRPVLGNHRPQAVFDLVCRLIGKGDGKHLPRRAGRGGKFGENRRDFLGGKGRRPFQLRHASLGHTVGHVGTVIGVAVLHKKRHSLHQHGGLSASRPRKDQKRALGGKDGFPLFFI